MVQKVKKRVNSYKKGAAGEREVAKLLQPWFPGCRRSLVQARCGYEAPDLIGGGLEEKFYVEVKRKKLITLGNLTKWQEKLLIDCQKYVDNQCPINKPKPVLFERENGGNWCCHVYMTTSSGRSAFVSIGCGPDIFDYFDDADDSEYARYSKGRP